jgi:hypothetical protein
VALPSSSLTAQEAPIDPIRGRALMQKSQRGEALTSEERAYLERVRQEIQRRASQKRAALGVAHTNSPRVLADWSALVPLTDLKGAYKGEDGGLYGEGHNEPPEAHRAAFLRECAKIQPLDEQGRPARDGKIVLLTVGFSNTHLESQDFVKTASADPQKSPQVVLVDGAIGGRAAVMWAYDGSQLLPKAEQERLDHEMDVLHMPKAHRGNRLVPEEKDTWPTLKLRLREAGVSPQQVQAVWMKHVEAGAAALGEFPAHAKALEADLASILNVARHHLPNLRIALLSSRTYGGWASPTAGSPEPYAYESAFAVRWLLQRQIQGDPQLNYDSSRGDVRAPIAVWGPYLWTCGDRPRKCDGLVWSEQDVRANDHMHPSEAGCEKVTEQLLKFLKTNEGTRTWFVKPGI